jgi:hypothetical protein
MKAMASDPLALVRSQIGRCLAELNDSGLKLSPLALHAKMDEIRLLAAANGLAAMESLARSSAQRALLPGHRVTLRCCMEHMDDALGSASAADCTTILAALAVRLH